MSRHLLSARDYGDIAIPAISCFISSFRKTPILIRCAKINLQTLMFVQCMPLMVYGRKVCFNLCI